MPGPLPTVIPAPIRNLLENLRARDPSHAAVVAAVAASVADEENVSAGHVIDTVQALAAAAEYTAEHTARVSGITLGAERLPKVTEKITALVSQFLAERRRSDRGGWAQIEDADLRMFRRILDALVNYKLEPDVDGARPLEVTLVNRRVSESLSYSPVPYSTVQSDEADDMAVFETLMFNLSVATRDVDIFMQNRPAVAAALLRRQPSEENHTNAPRALHPGHQG